MELTGARGQRSRAPQNTQKTDGEGEKETASSPARRKEVEMARFIRLNTSVRGASAAVLRTLWAWAGAWERVKCERERQLGCGRSSNETKVRGNMGKWVGAGARAISASVLRRGREHLWQEGDDKRALPVIEQGGRWKSTTCCSPELGQPKRREGRGSGPRGRMGQQAKVGRGKRFPFYFSKPTFKLIFKLNLNNFSFA
jgi:hypothetical protein